jgi:hypothetical protein
MTSEAKNDRSSVIPLILVGYIALCFFAPKLRTYFYFSDFKIQAGFLFSIALSFVYFGYSALSNAIKREYFYTLTYILLGLSSLVCISTYLPELGK